MGEPAQPSPSDRAATLDLARRIVDSVTNDEEMPLPESVECYTVVEAGEHFERAAVEAFVFELAQSLTLATAERDHALAVLDDALDRARVRALWLGEIATLRERGRKMP